MTPSFDDPQDEERSSQRLRQLEAAVKAAQPGHDAAAFLAAIVESSDDAIVSKSLAGIITTWNKAAERLFGYTADEVVGRPITVTIPDDRLDEEPLILSRIQANERIDHFETVRRRKDGTLIDVSLTISPIKDNHGRIIGASKIARDISERKRAAKHREMLLQEMHHRVKNLFAVTGSIIALAARTASTPADLANDMKDRLIALSRAHEMTLPSFTGDDAFRETSMTLFQLLSNILTPYENGRWHLHGNDQEVSAQKVTSLALLLHEFATNAAKYGSLSVPDGMLDITISTEAEMLTLQWLETNGPPLAESSSRQPGFGSRLEQIIAQSLQADVSRDWQPQGLSITLTVPRDTLAPSSRVA